MFAIRKGKWKLIEGDGGGYPKPKGGFKNLKKSKIEKDPVTGKWIKWSYYQSKPNGVYQLYDLESDPGEKKNVASQHPEIVKELQALLDSYRTSGRST